MPFKGLSSPRLRRLLSSPFFDGEGDCNACGLHVGRHSFDGGYVLCPPPGHSTAVRHAIMAMPHEFSARDILDFVSAKVSDDVVYQVLSRYVKDGKLQRVKRGRFAKTRPLIRP